VRNVAVCSYATSKFTKRSNDSIFELACQPCIQIIRESQISKTEIDAVLFSSCTAEQYGSNIICEMLGLCPRISHRIESLCNSGMNSIVSAYAYISSGLCESVLVVGAEKAKSPGAVLSWDISRGSFTFPVFWAALFAKAHMRKYGTTEEHMATVSVRNRANAQRNPNALFNSIDEVITLNDVMRSRRIVDPIKLLECGYSCEGSSAVLLLSETKAKQAKIDNPVWIKGIGQQISGASFNQASSDLTTISSSKIAARQAYTMSDTTPSHIDIAELHDAFTILQIIAVEDLGFVPEGIGGKFFDKNDAAVVLNPRGGILGCGHPIGTTGVAQLAEVAAQLSAKAGQRQVKGCKTALVHNLAAGGTSSTVVILSN
jgi:acetyl-CoA C-acetyltransferase